MHGNWFRSFKPKRERTLASFGELLKITKFTFSIEVFLFFGGNAAKNRAIFKPDKIRHRNLHESDTYTLNYNRIYRLH